MELLLSPSHLPSLRSSSGVSGPGPCMGILDHDPSLGRKKKKKKPPTHPWSFPSSAVTEQSASAKRWVRCRTRSLPSHPPEAPQASQRCAHMSSPHRPSSSTARQRPQGASLRPAQQRPEPTAVRCGSGGSSKRVHSTKTSSETSSFISRACFPPV